MKYISFSNDTETFKTRAVIEAVAKRPQAGGIQADEVFKRCRILAALQEANSTGVTLEDADHEHLVKLTKEFRFPMADLALEPILKAIFEAGAPPAIVQAPQLSGDLGDAKAA